MLHTQNLLYADSRRLVSLNIPKHFHCEKYTFVLKIPLEMLSNEIYKTIHDTPA